MSTMRLADYVIHKLADAGLRDVFMVTGGGAMHLNDAFGRNKSFNITCCHHEQACTMAAESYYRLTNRLAAVNVTTGPGGINALNGVFGAFTDSLGMIVISGQVKRETLLHTYGLNGKLRQLGDQEVDIISMVKGITKYAVLVDDPQKIRYHLERALYLAKIGRPGPVWLDIPIDIQGMLVTPSELESYNTEQETFATNPNILSQHCEQIIDRLTRSKKPVIYAGSGIRTSGEYNCFLKLIDHLKIPVVTAWNSNDLLWDNHPFYCGRPGTLGNRAGNFTVQNSDFILILGCRLNIRLVSYNWKSFAQKAYKVMIDIDQAELEKPTLKIDYPINADLKEFLPLLLKQLENSNMGNHQQWLDWCHRRLEKYPVVLDEYWNGAKSVNPYCFNQVLSSSLEEDEIIVTGDGTACVTAFQAHIIKNGQRLYHNSGCASMGYDLPAAIGASIATNKGKRIICIAGDGSIMMNLQELQTIRGLNLPVKIFLLNNSGYHSIRQTQKSFFADNIVGCGTDSGLSFPDFGKISTAFDIPYFKCETNSELSVTVLKTLDTQGPAICELMINLDQAFSPKLTSKKLDNGTMITAPLEDMAPFLDRKELEDNVFQEEL